jgi:hypothetical protein
MKEISTSVRRRRFLGGVGAGGLGAAAVIFGRAPSAKAVTPNLYHVACCELLHPNSGNLACDEGGSAHHWSWNCSYTTNGTLIQCECCEHYNPNYSTAFCNVYY